MKTYLKIFKRICIITIIPSLFFLTACNSDNDNEELPDNTIFVTANAAISELSESPINMKWGINDAIVLNGFNLVVSRESVESGSDKATFTGKINKDTKEITAYYPPYIFNNAIGPTFIKFLEQRQESDTDNNLKNFLYMTASYSGDINKIALDFQYQVSVLDFNITNNTGSDVKIEAVLVEGPEQAFYEKMYITRTDNDPKGTKQGLIINNPIMTKNGETFPAHMAVCLTSDSVLDGKMVKITVYTDKGEYPFTQTIEKSYIKGKRYVQTLTLK